MFSTFMTEDGVFGGDQLQSVEKCPASCRSDWCGFRKLALSMTDLCSPSPGGVELWAQGKCQQVHVELSRVSHLLLVSVIRLLPISNCWIKLQTIPNLSDLLIIKVAFHLVNVRATM
jgi:hypothetical protein